jgi:hypothetical protein
MATSDLRGWLGTDEPGRAFMRLSPGAAAVTGRPAGVRRRRDPLRAGDAYGEG